MMGDWSNPETDSIEQADRNIMFGQYAVRLINGKQPPAIHYAVAAGGQR